MLNENTHLLCFVRTLPKERKDSVPRLGQRRQDDSAAHAARRPSGQPQADIAAEYFFLPSTESRRLGTVTLHISRMLHHKELSLILLVLLLFFLFFFLSFTSFISFVITQQTRNFRWEASASTPLTLVDTKKVRRRPTLHPSSKFVSFRLPPPSPPSSLLFWRAPFSHGWQPFVNLLLLAHPASSIAARRTSPPTHSPRFPSSTPSLEGVLDRRGRHRVPRGLGGRRPFRRGEGRARRIVFLVLSVAVSPISSCAARRRRDGQTSFARP